MTHALFESCGEEGRGTGIGRGRGIAPGREERWLEAVAAPVVAPPPNRAPSPSEGTAATKSSSKIDREISEIALKSKEVEHGIK